MKGGVSSLAPNLPRHGCTEQCSPMSYHTLFMITDNHQTLSLVMDIAFMWSSTDGGPDYMGYRLIRDPAVMLYVNLGGP